jgi:hypothetical protein
VTRDHVLRQHDLVPALFDEFKIRGPNGTHTCYTVTPAQCNLRETCTVGCSHLTWLEPSLMDLLGLLYMYMQKAMSMEVRSFITLSLFT